MSASAKYAAMNTPRSFSIVVDDTPGQSVEATVTLADGQELHYEADSMPAVLAAISSDPDVLR
jgi:hypothetical protein